MLDRSVLLGERVCGVLQVCVDVDLDVGMPSAKCTHAHAFTRANTQLVVSDVLTYCVLRIVIIFDDSSKVLQIGSVGTTALPAKL